MASVKYLHSYKLDLNVSELHVILVSLEDRIVRFKELKHEMSRHDTISSEIFAEKMEEMERLIDKIRGMQ